MAACNITSWFFLHPTHNVLLQKNSFKAFVNQNEHCRQQWYPLKHTAYVYFKEQYIYILLDSSCGMNASLILL